MCVGILFFFFPGHNGFFFFFFFMEPQAAPRSVSGILAEHSVNPCLEASVSHASDFLIRWRCPWAMKPHPRQPGVVLNVHVLTTAFLVLR